MLESLKAMDRKKKLAIAAAATIVVAVAAWTAAEYKSNAKMLSELDEADRKISI